MTGLLYALFGVSLGSIAMRPLIVWRLTGGQRVVGLLRTREFWISFTVAMVASQVPTWLDAAVH